MKTLWIGIGILVLLVPLGLLASGTAWGEWGTAELGEQLGFVPKGLETVSTIWAAPIPDYEIPGINASLGYVLSAAIGVGVVALATWWLGKIVARP